MNILCTVDYSEINIKTPILYTLITPLLPCQIYNGKSALEAHAGVLPLDSLSDLM